MANLYKIRELCERRSISIRELASRINRNESTVQALIRNGSTSVATLEDIAKVLGVSPAYFFEGYTGLGADELRRELEYKNALLQEKERLIAVLLAEKEAPRTKSDND